MLMPEDPWNSAVRFIDSMRRTDPPFSLTKKKRHFTIAWFHSCDLVHGARVFFVFRVKNHGSGLRSLELSLHFKNT